MVIRTEMKTKTNGQTGQRDLTFILDFPGNLCWAAFAILEMFFLLMHLPGPSACREEECIRKFISRGPRYLSRQGPRSCPWEPWETWRRRRIEAHFPCHLLPGWSPPWSWTQRHLLPVGGPRQGLTSTRYPTRTFFLLLKNRPELFFKISAFRVFPSRLFPSRSLQIF